MTEVTVFQAVAQVTVTVFYVSAAAVGSVLYFRRVRLPRPAIGTFNGRDIFIMMGFVVALPFLYITIPSWTLAAILALVFAGVLSVGYRPVFGRRATWFGIVVLLGGNLVAASALHDVDGSQFAHWLINSSIVLLLVIAAANINAQGGMRLQHATWFAVALGIYDAFFAWVVPLTQQLMEVVRVGTLTPLAGISLDGYDITIGMGDLLVYALYSVTAYKTYRRSGLLVALIVIVLFGGIIPALIPYISSHLSGHTVSLIPAQVFFGPAALGGYLLLRRRCREQPIRTPRNSLDRSRANLTTRANITN